MWSMSSPENPPLHETRRAATEPNARRRVLFYVLMVALIVTGIAGGGELMARLAGHEPWETLDWYLDTIGEPVMTRYDAEIGWLNAPGRYVMPSYDPAARETGDPMVTTIWPGGLRATAPARHPRAAQVLFCGCSFTQGFAISDAETFAYKLQARLPEVEVLNFGTAGYGTYQCLLRLRRYFDVGAPSPAVVAYGLFQDHEGRNVAAAYWLQSLARVSRRGFVAVPYCALDDGGRLDCRPPEASYRAWPGTGSSALLTFLQGRYERFRTRSRQRQARAVTEALLREMAALVRSRGATFLVVLLHAGDTNRRAYRDFLSAAKIDFVDCVDPRYDTPEMVVRGEVHPNGKMNTVWADCIEGRLRNLLARSPTGAGIAEPGDPTRR